jgi:soluble lytic murein transglycosylase-like protein
MIILHNINRLTNFREMQRTEKRLHELSLEPSTSEFQNIFKNVIQLDQESDTSDLKSPVINQSRLLLLVKALQIQMNSKLYNSILNNTLEMNSLASKIVQDVEKKLDRFTPHASRNSQKTSKLSLQKGDNEIDRIIDHAAQKYDIDPNLIYSVIQVESNFNPSAISSKGAKGLMQLMPETAKELGVENAYNAHDNVMGGTRYLRMLLDRYDGQVDLALAAYNWGMGNVEKNPGKLPAETLDYLEKVNKAYKNRKA